MVSGQARPKLVAIVGPTASGKSDLAMKIAREFNGEIICADSRTIYKGMDIGTAKPSKKNQKAVPHWGLDLLEPGRRFSAAQFKDYAQQAIQDIQNRGKLPILVGGTGLYVDAVLYDFKFSPRAGKCDPLNPRHRQRTGVTWRHKSLLPGVLVIGLLPSDEQLKRRIEVRAQKLFSDGVVGEARALVKTYGEPAVRRTAGIIYPIVLDELAGKIDRGAALEQFKTKDWQYARRQKTWFRRGEHIKWYDSGQTAYKVVKKALLNT